MQATEWVLDPGFAPLAPPGNDNRKAKHDCDDRPSTGWGPPVEN